MPSSARASVAVYFSSEAKRALRDLAKRFRHIRFDLDPTVARLEAGEVIGDRVPGTGPSVYKARLPNSDAVRGKSGGYRLIYHTGPSGDVFLVTIYSKSDRADVSAEFVRRVLEEYEGPDPSI
jgi:mRNA-degrading endonuclease RelE of RelBE toxin-antitoxin system